MPLKKEKRRKQKFKEKQLAEKERIAIESQIKEVLTNEKPATVRQLVALVKKEQNSNMREILAVVRMMEERREIILQEPLIEPLLPPKRPKEFFFGRNYFAYEFWLTITTLLLTVTLVLVDVRSGFFFYVRYAVVCFFMLILTGWSLTAVIFPKIDDELRFLERLATAIGLSIVVLVVDGLFLNYTFRFNPVSIVLSLTFFVLICLGISIGLRLKLGRDGFIFKKKSKETIEVQLDR